MDEFGVYKMYIALKLHFTTDNYDITKRNGKVKASRQAFAKRTDLFSIKKISKTYSDEEIANFLVSNFVSGDRWGGMFDSEAGKTYTDLDNLLDELDKDNLTFKDAFAITKSQHPYILKMFLRKSVSLETMVILEKIFPYLEYFDKELEGDILWPDTSRLIKKYKPFLKFDKEKYNEIFRKRNGS